jgi:hypothetical protein
MPLPTDVWGRLVVCAVVCVLGAAQPCLPNVRIIPNGFHPNLRSKSLP